MSIKDYYKILEIERNASEEQIKKAYRKLAIKYHPDKNAGNKEAEESFKAVAEAYEILGNPEKKSRYDRGENLSGGNSGFNHDDVMEEFMRSFGGGGFGFGGFGRQQQQRRQQAKPIGKDLRIKINLTIHEIVSGVHKKIVIQREVNCEDCKGTGAKDKDSIINCSNCGGSGQVSIRQHTQLGIFVQQHTCQKCGGQGKEIVHKCKKCSGNGLVSKNDNIEFDIPAGALNGVSLNIANFGNEAKGGGDNGKLIIDIIEIEHATFKREGVNIVTDVFISYCDAVIGNDSLEVETIDGPVKLKIQEGTEPGKVLRLKGKGIPHLENPSTRGDQMIFINIFIPKKIDEEEKKTINKLKKIKSLAPDIENTQHIKGIYSRMKEYEELH